MTSLLALGAMALALAVLAIGLAQAIQRNIREAEGFREQLGARLDALPLARVLRRLALEPRTYVHEQPAVAIHAQMARCRGCACARLCEAALRGDAAPHDAAPARFAFCPNYPALTALAR